MKEYYCDRNGKQVGPFSARQLKDLAAAGQLAPTDLVWTNGLPNWVPVANLKGLFPATADSEISPRRADRQQPTDEPRVGSRPHVWVIAAAAAVVALVVVIASAIGIVWLVPWRGPNDKGGATTGGATSNPEADSPDADTLQTLLNGLPDNARPRSINDTLAFDRANAWIKKNVLGKRVAVPHPLEPMIFNRTDDAPHYDVTIGKPTLGQPAVPVTLFGVQHNALVFSKVGNPVFGGQFLFQGVDEALAEQLRKLQGKTGAISGRLDECTFRAPPFGATDASILGATLIVRVSQLRLGKRLLSRSPHLRDVEPGKGNPFGVKTEAIPDDAESRAFAARAKLQGDPADENAKPWARTGKTAAPGMLDGEWEGRWWAKGNGVWAPNAGPIQIKTVGQTVYILWKDRKYSSLIVAVRDGNRLIGRSASIDSPEDVGFWTGLVVDDTRIDGAWLESDGSIQRWDFRRAR